MRVSKSFLNEYVDINNIDFRELAEKMVFAGNEYDSISKISNATNLVVGEIIDCVKHPESTKLSICQVNIGETVQILCGAPNVRKGIKVIVAQIGATLGDITIGKAKLAGMESNGMICSLSELGIESKYQSEEDKTGIHILPDDAPVGEDAIKYLGFDDEVIDFDLTANRADLLSMLGMAYEVGAIYDLKVTEPEVKLNETGDINDTYELSVKTDNCPIYLGKKVNNIVIKESPMFIKNRLMACGIRSINNVVDISNYVMLEYGQPLHFFDADLLGNYVEVRMAKDNEELKTLDEKDRVLTTDDIVIANREKAVALAGVMGGYDTEINDNTKNIFIEAAIFDSAKIRNTSKKILRSEASSRYEKGVDANRTLKAINRACELLQKYASGSVVGGVLTHDKANHDDKVINITLDKINQVLGLSLTKEDVAKVFDKLGFNYKGEFEVTVPSRRLDISIKEDIIEEVGRIYGYDNVVGKLPFEQGKQGSYSKEKRLIKNIKNYMLGLGLNEVITYSLIDDVSKDKFVDKFNPVYLLDPMSEDKKVLRNSLITSHLNVFEYNYARKVANINIFEIGSCYSIEDTYVEKPKLSGLMYGNVLSNLWQNKNIKVDFYLVKGVITSLLQYLGFTNRISFTKDIVPDMHPGRTAAIYIDNVKVGFMGQVHPLINKNEVYVFEIDLEKIQNIKTRHIKYKEPNKYPTVSKDVAFVTSSDSDTILNVIKKAGGKLLSDIDVFDVYEMENSRSIAYKLTFQDSSKTLSDEEVNELFNNIIKSVEEKTDAKLRQ